MRTSLSVVAVAALLAVPSIARAQNPRGEAKATLAGKAVAIEYGRPALKGRDMLGQAQVGQAWRMGADAATTLTTEADLAFGAAAVPKGKYVLTAKKVAEGQWSLLVNKEDRSAVVAEVPLASSKLGESVEMLTIELRGEKGAGEFEMKWGTTALKAPFSAK